MCRVYGYVHRESSYARLARTGALLRHGGPDGHYLEHGPGWALGATRLAVMAPRHGAQPYALGPVRAVFNGEIYNHRRLRERLAADGYRVADPCDGAVLPALYHRYGASFAEHLDGMYAVAVVDLRGGAPRLVLATDGTGVKPLYYHRDARGGLCFASEVEALRHLSGAGRARPGDCLDAYLTTKTPLGARSPYEGVAALEPGTVLSVSADGRLERHRGAPPAAPPPQPPHRPGTGRAQTVPDAVPDPDPDPDPAPAPEPEGLAAAAGELRELLRTEVRRLAVADAPVAAVLSGGLDSSLVTGLLAEAVPAPHCFHIRYRGTWPADESAYARAAARRYGARLHEVELDPARIPALLPEVVRRLGLPNADPITVSTYALFRAVREAGFTVALTGDAADELFGGYDRVRRAVAADGDWAAGYVRALAAVPSPARARLYHPEYRASLRRAPTAEDEIRGLLRGRDGDRLAAVSEVEIGLRLPAYHLRRVDHLSMASAVEVRPPFCQPSVVAAARRLPARLKVHRGRGKRVLYAAAAGVVPEAVLDRPKQPFTLPVAAMLAPGSALLAHAREVLAPSELRSGGLLDPAAVTALLDRQEARPDPAAALAVWSLMVFEVWRRQADEPAGSPDVRRAA